MRLPSLFASATAARRGTVLRLVALALLLVLPVALGQDFSAASSAPSFIRFKLVPNPPFVNCLARYPGDPSRPPTADVTVRRGQLNEVLNISLRNIKPGLAFDLFTVQRSPFLANGQPDPAFAATFNKSFGLAWYQSDLQINRAGGGDAQIQTILLDQIFGFDPDVNLAPTNTFHVGFWFNDPADAAPCGFTGVTPFNGDHQAGPLAMISLPNADTGLGPLCSNPDTSVPPVKCNP